MRLSTSCIRCLRLSTFVDRALRKSSELKRQGSQKLLKLMDDLMAGLNDAVLSLEPTFYQLKEQTSQAFDKLKSQASENLPKLQNQVSELKRQGSQKLLKLMDDLMAGLNDAVLSLELTFYQLKEQTSQAFDKLKSQASENLPKLQNQVSELKRQGSQKLLKLMDDLMAGPEGDAVLSLGPTFYQLKEQTFHLMGGLKDATLSLEPTQLPRHNFDHLFIPSLIVYFALAKCPPKKSLEVPMMGCPGRSGRSDYGLNQRERKRKKKREKTAAICAFIS